MKRSYQIPVRIGDKIYIEDVDGTRREIDVLLAAELAAMWLDVIKGLAVWWARRG